MNVRTQKQQEGMAQQKRATKRQRLNNANRAIVPESEKVRARDETATTHTDGRAGLSMVATNNEILAETMLLLREMIRLADQTGDLSHLLAIKKAVIEARLDLERPGAVVQKLLATLDATFAKAQTQRH